MTDNDSRYALAALRERRAVIDGELRQCEQRMRHLKAMLGHLDASLSLFDPEGRSGTPSGCRQDSRTGTAADDTGDTIAARPR
jgi:hypothetical protein